MKIRRPQGREGSIPSARTSPFFLACPLEPARHISAGLGRFGPSLVRRAVALLHTNVCTLSFLSLHYPYIWWRSLRDLFEMSAPAFNDCYPEKASSAA